MGEDPLPQVAALADVEGRTARLLAVEQVHAGQFRQVVEGLGR